MEKWQKEHITKNLAELITLTTFNTIVKAELVANGILNQAIDVDFLEAQEKQNGKSAACGPCYQMLMGRKGAYKVLYKALVETNQSGAAKVLVRVPPGLFIKPLTYLEISAEVNDFQNVEIEVNGKTFKLHEFFAKMDWKILDHIFRKTIPEVEFYDSFITKEKKLILAKNTIPSKPSFYVPRFLSNRIKLDKSIFKADCKDVFVFKNSIKRNKLSEIARPHHTDTSTSQLTKLTRRFIYLDEDEDWTELKRLAKVPIHLINFETDQEHFVLEDSSAPSDILGKLGSENERIYMTEEDFVRQQLSQVCTASSVCICDAPGMGKTFLLANIARLFIENCAGRIVLFVQLTTFVQDNFPASQDNILDPDISLAKVLGYICSSRQNTELLMNLSKAKLLQLEIFFDGFDEISKDQVEWTKQTFQSIATSFGNVRIYITSRPHMRQELEQSLSVVAYDILPFNQQNQIDFLVQFWQHKKLTSDQASLQSYPTSCQESVKKSLTKNDKEIAGIPLLCQLIAEVYGNKKAFRSIKTGSFCDVPLKISGMYQKFIEKKIHVALNNKEDFDDIKLVHIWHALKLLFPGFHFHEDSQFENINDLLISPLILKVGIIQKHSSPALEFLHRTFAEYLVAEYFVKKLQQNEMQKTEEMKCSSMSILREVLRGHPHSNSYKWYYKFESPVIVAFFDSALGEVYISKELKIPFTNAISFFSNTNFSWLLCACCEHNLFNMFSFSEEALTKCDKSQILECFTHEDCYQLLKVCIEKSAIQIFDRCLQFVTEGLNFDVAQINTYQSTNTNITLLQIAADCANYAAVEYFMDIVPLRNQEILLRSVLVPNKIDARVNILELLLNKDPTLIQETPDILVAEFTQIDVRLFKILLNFRANLTCVNKDRYNCAIHAASYMSPSDYHELVQLLLTDCKAEYLFLDNDKWKEPFYYIIKHVTLLPETVELLLSIPGMDISMKDRWEESLLFSAVKADDMNELQQLVNRRAHCFVCRVDYTAKDWSYRSLLHVAAEDGKVEMVRYLLSLKLNPDSGDKRGSTPLHYAASNNKLSVVEVLVENGANVHAKDNGGQTALHVFAMWSSSKSVELIRYLIRKGANVNDLDFRGNTPLHCCWESKEVWECLIELGADIHAKNKMGKTPAQDNPLLWNSSNSNSDAEDETDSD